jgi:hypothetical protein
MPFCENCKKRILARPRKKYCSRACELRERKLYKELLDEESKEKLYFQISIREKGGIVMDKAPCKHSIGKINGVCIQCGEPTHRRQQQYDHMHRRNVRNELRKSG